MSKERLKNFMINLKEPLISIIIPVYNVSQYIDQCLKSIINQTYRNLEILIIDDGSSDGSGLICDSYSREDSRVKVFHNSNMGVSAARNYGIKKCTGEWITFVDSDDFIDMKMIEVMFRASIKSNAQIIIGEEVCTDKDASKFGFGEDNIDPDYQEVSCQSIIEKLLNNRMRKSIWGMLFRCELIKKSFFSEGKVYEDIPYLPLVMRTNPDVIWVNRIIYAYRKNSASITHQTINARSIDRIEMKELQVQRISRFFPELTALAIGSLYADCMVWWIKADEAEDEEAGSKLKETIQECIKKYPLSWKILGNNKLGFGRKASMAAVAINFNGACSIKKYIMKVTNK